MKGVEAFEAWDETYFHTNHNPKNRTVLMVRDAMKGDPHTQPEPWTWVRTQTFKGLFVFDFSNKFIIEPGANVRTFGSALTWDPTMAILYSG